MRCQIRLDPSLIKKGKQKNIPHHSTEQNLRAHKYISDGEKRANSGRFLQHHHFLNVKKCCLRWLKLTISKEKNKAATTSTAIAVGSSRKTRNAMSNSALALYLIPSLLVQVYTAVQWDTLNQLHGQNPAAWQLINHFRDFEILVSLQQGPRDETKTSLKINTPQSPILGS